MNDFKVLGRLLLPFLIISFSGILGLILPIGFANSMGKFFQSLTSGGQPIQVLKSEAVKLLLIFAAMPVAGYIGTSLFLKKALEHDRDIVSGIIDKNAADIKDLGPEKLLQLLEIDINRYRFTLKNLFALPIITLGVLLFSFRTTVSPMANLLCLVTAFVPVVISAIFRYLPANKEKTNFEYIDKRRNVERNLAENKSVINILKLKSIFAGVYGKNYEIFLSKYRGDVNKVAALKSAVLALPWLIQALVILLYSLLIKGPNFLAAIMMFFFLLPAYMQLANLVVQGIDDYQRLKIYRARLSVIFDLPHQHLQNQGIKEFEVKNLNMQFDDKIISYPDFKIGGNERVQIVGANGTGKSTLLKILHGQLEPSGGKIVYTPLEKQDYFAFSPQDSPIFKSNLNDNIVMGKDIDQKALNALIDDFGLASPELLDPHRQGDFSGGESKKIDLIRVFIHSNGFAILDEPTNHLDDKSVEQLKAQLSGRTVIMSTHDARMDDFFTRQISLDGTICRF